MIPYINGYDTYQLIQSSSHNVNATKNEIDSFVALGWDILGILHIGEIDFIQLGWLSSKGNPIYPEESQS